MNMKKIVASAAALSLTAAVAVGGTLAWLTANSGDPVTNVFTYEFGGQDAPINITLVDEFTPNSKFYPGADVNKDVSVTVEANSMNSYVYLMVDNGFDGVTGVDLNLNTTNWTFVQEIEDGRSVYRYNSIVNTDTEDQTLENLIDHVTFANDMTHATLKGITDPTITVQAFAVQSDGTGMSQSVADEQAVAFFG